MGFVPLLLNPAYRPDPVPSQVRMCFATNFRESKRKACYFLYEHVFQVNKNPMYNIYKKRTLQEDYFKIILFLLCIQKDFE